MRSDRVIARNIKDEFHKSFDAPLPPTETWPALADIRQPASLANNSTSYATAIQSLLRRPPAKLR